MIDILYGILRICFTRVPVVRHYSNARARLLHVTKVTIMIGTLIKPLPEPIDYNTGLSPFDGPFVAFHISSSSSVGAKGSLV